MKRVIALAAMVAVATTAANADEFTTGQSNFTAQTLAWPTCSASVNVSAAKGSALVAGRASPSPGPEEITSAAGGTVVNKTVISEKTLRNTSHQGTYSAINSVPGVIDTQTKTGSGSDSLQIRGIKLDNSANYRLDGALVLNNQINMPIEDKCRIEVLKGAGALEYGLAPPAGIVNYVMKRATMTPVATAGFLGSGFGEGIASIDVGQRVGPHHEFGYRINLAGGQMGAVADGSGGTRYVGAFAGDWYIGKRGVVQVDAEQVGLNVIEQASILENKAKNGVLALPDASRINPSNLLSGGSWSWSRGWEQNFAARFGYALSPDSTFVFESGRSESNRPWRMVSQIGNYNVLTGLGTETVTLVKNQDYINDFYDAHVQTQSGVGPFTNAITVGFNENQRDFNNPSNPKVTFKQNIYTPFMVPPPVSKQTAITYQPQDNHDADPYISDSLSFNDKLRVIAGVRQIQYTQEFALAKGGWENDVSSTLAPSAGIIYDILPNLTAYASYVESLQETGQAPASAANAFAVLPPEKAQQKEVGIRGNDLWGVFTPTLAYFRINEANAVVNPTTNVYGLDGTTTYDGLETTDTIAVSRLFDINAGAILERATQFSDDPAINGLPAENVPHLNYSLGFSYTLPFAREWSVNADRSYTSYRPANPQNQAIIPGVGVYSAGTRWVKVIGGRRFEFGMNVRNLTNERYFASAYNGNLAIGAPRTITVNMRIGI